MVALAPSISLTQPSLEVELPIIPIIQGREKKTFAYLGPRAVILKCFFDTYHCVNSFRGPLHKLEPDNIVFEGITALMTPSVVSKIKQKSMEFVLKEKPLQCCDIATIQCFCLMSCEILDDNAKLFQNWVIQDILAIGTFYFIYFLFVYARGLFVVWL